MSIEKLNMDPRIMGFHLAMADAEEDKVSVGSFSVSALTPFPRASVEPPASVDQYHMYTILGQHMDCPLGHVTIMHSSLDPEAQHVRTDPSKRYVIIVDHATGARLRVELPSIGAHAS